MANFRSTDKDTIKKMLAQMKTWLHKLMYCSIGARIPLKIMKNLSLLTF